MSVLHNEHEEFRRIYIGFESPPWTPLLVPRVPSSNRTTIVIVF